MALRASASTVAPPTGSVGSGAACQAPSQRTNDRPLARSNTHIPSRGAAKSQPPG